MEVWKMANPGTEHKTEKIIVALEYTLFNRLHALALEYTVSTDTLVNLALQRLSDDVDFMRDLRAGKFKLD
jgi:hypothetical protein